jgi:hypothetical protein
MIRDLLKQKGGLPKVHEPNRFSVLSSLARLATPSLLKSHSNEREANARRDCRAQRRGQHATTGMKSRRGSSKEPFFPSGGLTT